MSGLGVPEVMVLLVAAVILFGPEKLPELARKAARVINYVRNIANNAQNQISSELGPEFKDFDIRDPRGSIQRHLLDQVDPILSDVKEEIGDTKRMFSDTGEDLRSIRGELADLSGDIRSLSEGSAQSADADDWHDDEDADRERVTYATDVVAGAETEAHPAADEDAAPDVGSGSRRTPFDVDAT